MKKGGFTSLHLWKNRRSKLEKETCSNFWLPLNLVEDFWTTTQSVLQRELMTSLTDMPKHDGPDDELGEPKRETDFKSKEGNQKKFRALPSQERKLDRRIFLLIRNHHFKYDDNEEAKRELFFVLRCPIVRVVFRLWHGICLIGFSQRTTNNENETTFSSIISRAFALSEPDDFCFSYLTLIERAVQRGGR